jgi:ATP-dependent helicase/nuclease subunit B
MRSQYEFDPALSEFGFGGKDDTVAAWELELGGGRKLALQGRIDRVDIWRDPGGDSLLAVVTDYKSGGKKLDQLLVENGIQLQLLAYLGALKRWSTSTLPGYRFPLVGGGESNRASAVKFVPAGAFYVSLRGKFEGGDSREEVLADTESSKLAYRHNGRFNADWLKRFDRRMNVSTGDQFNYRLKKDGAPHANSSEALPAAEFEKLLDLVESQLRQLGDEIFSGRAAVDPYRKGKETPCEFCDYRAACRLDEWTQEFRELRAVSKTEETAE